MIRELEKRSFGLNFPCAGLNSANSAVVVYLSTSACVRYRRVIRRMQDSLIVNPSPAIVQSQSSDTDARPDPGGREDSQSAWCLAVLVPEIDSKCSDDGQVRCGRAHRLPFDARAFLFVYFLLLMLTAFAPPPTSTTRDKTILLLHPFVPCLFLLDSVLECSGFDSSSVYVVDCARYIPRSATFPSEHAWTPTKLPCCFSCPRFFPGQHHGDPCDLPFAFRSVQRLVVSDHRPPESLL